MILISSAFSKPARRWRKSRGCRSAHAPRGDRPHDNRGLRAIPWSFAWTQTRALIPAWYGAGTALAAELEQGGAQKLRELAERSAFFSTLMRSIERALAVSES